VVDEDVEPAEVFDGFINQRTRRLALREIARERECLPVELCDARTSRIRRARVAVTSDVRARFGERDGDCLPQTGRSAGDERDLVDQSELVEDQAVTSCSTRAGAKRGMRR